MEVKVTYSKQQLDEAVDFIATHNPSFLGQHSFIRDEILDHMRKMARDPEGWLGATMGYTLWGDRTFEGVDSDENTIHFEITVDPAVGRDYEEDDIAEEIVNSSDIALEDVQ